MAVYTYFGSMSAIVREIVHDGFARLKRLFDLVEATDDPVADLALLGRVYRHNAITNRARLRGDVRRFVSRGLRAHRGRPPAWPVHADHRR